MATDESREWYGPCPNCQTWHELARGCNTCLGQVHDTGYIGFYEAEKENSGDSLTTDNPEFAALPNLYPMEGLRMTPDLIAGIDPGVNGGITLLTQQGEIVGCYPMPETQSEIVELIAEYAPRIACLALEKVGPMPKQGIASTSVFMRNYGFLQGVIATLQIRREDVLPRTWQQAMQCMSKGNKAVTRQKAQQLFPKQKITNKVADSLLIAEWLRRTIK